MDLMRSLGLGTDPKQVFQRARAQEALVDAQERAATARVVADTRALWKNALLVDETASWLSTFEANPGLLSGLTVILSLIAAAHAHDAGDDAPAVRLIRGALSAIEQQGKQGSQITPELMRAVASAANAARGLVDDLSDRAVIGASVYVSNLVRSLEAR